MESRQATQISVVILCYKANNLVPAFVARMKKVLEAKRLSYQLVLVANYNENEINTDKTTSIVLELAINDPTIIAVAKKKEGMMGWDMRSGLEIATGKTVAVIDGDGQMPPEDVVRVYDHLTSGNFDMAKTYRDERFDGSARIMISRIYNFLLKILFPKVKIIDANSKPKIFTKEALSRLYLKSNDWFIDAEIIIQASYLNFRIGEIPTKFFENKFRKSFVGVIAIFQFLKNLINYRITFQQKKIL